MLALLVPAAQSPVPTPFTDMYFSVEEACLRGYLSGVKCVLLYYFVMMKGPNKQFNLKCAPERDTRLPFRSAILDDVMSQSELTTECFAFQGFY